MITTKTRLLIVAVFLAVLAVAGFVTARLEAIEPGGSCENSSQRDSCSGPGAACISADQGDDYCSIESQSQSTQRSRRTMLARALVG